MVMHLKTLRQRMVDCQLRPVDVSDLALLRAFLTVERADFFSPSLQNLAYCDSDLRLESQISPRFAMRPALLAKLIQLLALKRGDKVLIIGAATGYSAAIISQMSAHVIALEEDPALFDQARDNLAASNCDVTLACAALKEGWVEQAPYSAILIEGRIEGEVPAEILAQLMDRGRLAVVEGSQYLGIAKLYKREKDRFSTQMRFNLAAPLIPSFSKAAEFSF